MIERAALFGWLGERDGRVPEPGHWRVLVARSEGVSEVVFRDVAAEDNAGNT
jgi:hypothetical protein